MAESYDDPYQAPGFNYQDFTRPPDDPYRDPGFDYNDYRAPDRSALALTSGLAALTSGSPEGLAFSAWHRQNLAADPIDLGQMNLGITGVSAGNSLTMMDRLRALWERTFRPPDRSQDREV
jgi:hypothetical protein